MDCPVCQKPLTSQRGTQQNPVDGITVYCPHRDCPAQEVSGHGANEKAALQVIRERRYTSEQPEEL